MKKLYLLFSLFLISGISFAQNLVMNPSFDVYITCPGFGQYGSNFISNWDKPTIASSDYYNFNCPGIQPTEQAPRTGEGYSGIICYNFGTEYREYITGTFLTPLVAGTYYDVEFWVSLHNGYIQAIEEVGAYISTTAPGPFGNALHINVIPQIENTSGALNDTMNWKQVSGQYLATGGEQFITIGNFNDDSTTTITQPGSTGSFGAYYFIEDVSVIADSTTSISEHSNAVEPVINLIHGNTIQITLPESNHWENSEFGLFDVTGKQVLSEKLEILNSHIQVGELKSGIYFARIVNTVGKTFSSKIFISATLKRN